MQFELMNLIELMMNIWGVWV